MFFPIFNKKLIRAAAGSPTGLSIIVTGKSDIIVIWTVSELSNTQGYVIFYQLLDSAVENITIDDSNETSVNIGGLEYGGTVLYHNGGTLFPSPQSCYWTSNHHSSR